MNVQQGIKDKLTDAFEPLHLEVINESDRHNVPPNSETHFKVVVVSQAFENKRQVARHQLIYQLLSEELSRGVHALAIHTYTEGEWERATDSPASPECLGGSKPS